MTREYIIRMAQKAGIAKHGLGWTCWEGQLERFAALVAAAEREACAQIAEDFDACDPKHIAAAIRARGEKLSSQDNLSKSPANRRYTCHVCNRQEMVRAKFDEESG